MPKVHFVKSAMKDYPEHGITKGDSYYWWKFRYMSRHMSKTHPKRSQLTRSYFLSSLYTIEDSVSSDGCTIEQVEDLIVELETLQDECQNSLDNMPEQLQDTSESGELLQARIDGLGEWIEGIQAIVDDNEDGLDDVDLASAVNDCNPGIG